MKRNNYYRVNKVGGENVRVVLADQLMTEDIRRWSLSFAEVYSSVFKPLVDFFLFSYKLSNLMGIQGPIGMYSWFVIATIITNLNLPPYGKLLAKEQELEGQFRDAHQKLITNGEMVAFMGGEEPEVSFLNGKFKNILAHINKSNILKWRSDLIMGYVNKYFASVIGFLLMVRPIYYGEMGLGNADAAALASHYVASRQIMENLTNAVLALFEVQKKVGNLSGLTMRVHDLLVKLQTSEKVFDEFIALCPAPDSPPKFIESDELKFENVSVYRPDGTLLAKNLNFEVPHMRRVMITGPNGCGKSSLFRILRGLWPLISGTIYSPKSEDIYFLSQVNFVPRGTLRQLLTYPHSEETLQERKVSDEHLWECMKLAHLENLEAQGHKPTLDTVLDWEVALSPGQKQRMAFARLLYHKPRYAILDECTNGISPEVEADLYQRCADWKISVFSISHKDDLKKFHDYELHYVHNNQGDYEWKQIPAA
jgi:ATP-binding cassette subfamily D (ALD) protein 3